MIRDCHEPVMATLKDEVHKFRFGTFLEVIPFCNIATSFLLLFYVVFLINVIKLCKPLSKLDLPTLCKGSRE